VVNTQMLIANIAEELTAEDVSPIGDDEARTREAKGSGPAGEARPGPSGVAGRRFDATSHGQGEDDDDEAPIAFESVRRFIPWIAAAGVLAVLGIGTALLTSRGGDEVTAAASDEHRELAQHESLRTTPERHVASASAVKADSEETEIEEDAAPAALPSPPAPPTEASDDEAALLPGDAPQDSLPADVASAGDVAEAPATASSGRSSRRRSPKREKPSTAAVGTAPPPPSDAPAEPSASDLLQDAQRALQRGASSEAYQLASRSYSKKKSAAAVRTMARAACRMKSRSKAKAAFERLSMSDRAGIRAECRDDGIRLGL